MQPDGDRQGSGQQAESVSAVQPQCRQARLGRQARVGILPNGNSRPLPQPKPPQLTGRWQRLRSTRRPPDQADGPAPLADPGDKAEGKGNPADRMAEDAASGQHGASSLITERDGRILGVDIERLTASIPTHGKSAPVRSGFLDRLGLADPPSPLSRDPTAAPGEGAGRAAWQDAEHHAGRDSRSQPEYMRLDRTAEGDAGQDPAQLDGNTHAASRLSRFIGWLRYR